MGAGFEDSPSTVPKAALYSDALARLSGRMSDIQRALLAAHYRAPGHAATARELAEATGIAEWEVVNAQYGRLGAMLRDALDFRAEGQQSYAIASFLPPGVRGNTEWLWIMHPELAEALSSQGWAVPAESVVRQRPSDDVTRFWTCHWQFRLWRDDINAEFAPVCLSASNSFTKRGVSVGDTVYIVSLSGGQLYLGGRMVVKRIVSREEAVRLWDNGNLYDAEEWIVDPEKQGTPLHLHRRLDSALTKRLRFDSNSGPKEPFFVSDTDLDNQATRGVRRLTRESAALLDRIIEVTDRLPRSAQVVTVTAEMLAGAWPIPDEFRLPEEVPAGMAYSEGSIRRVEVNRYERDAEARLACIAAHGTVCCVCGFSFGAAYGAEADGYIHVHHVRPLAEAGGERAVDPVEDLRPVCPNCHAVLHLGGQCRSIERVRDLLAQHRHAERTAAADPMLRSGSGSV
jgi:hypothetical protein